MAAVRAAFLSYGFTTRPLRVELARLAAAVVNAIGPELRIETRTLGLMLTVLGDIAVRSTALQGLLVRCTNDMRSFFVCVCGCVFQACEEPDLQLQALLLRQSIALFVPKQWTPSELLAEASRPSSNSLPNCAVPQSLPLAVQWR